MNIQIWPAGFTSKISFADCWEWTASKTHNGYGRYGVRSSRSEYAHRVAYELVHGPIPEGLQIDHLCRNRACVNPAHLEAVPQSENMKRGMAPTMVLHRTGTCQKGHPLSTLSTGRHFCRECNNARVRAYHARRKAAAR